MSLWSRIANVFRGERVSREIDEELSSHIEEAIAKGRDPAEARRAFGSTLRLVDETRDRKVIAWVDSLRADTVFGWRQIRKRKVASAAAILSLGLSVGSCVAAFRIIDALLLRPLPVAHPEQLYALSREGINFTGQFQSHDGWAYPAFLRMRDAVTGKAELLAISYTDSADLTYRSDAEMEKAQVQYASGRMFDVLGLTPAAGRLLGANDDLKPGASPYAVISYDYWTRRFGREAGAIGSTFRMEDRVYQIVGVAPPQFTGTETGIFTDVFVPATMNPSAVRDDATWHRILLRVAPGMDPEAVRQRLDSVSREFETERAKGFKNMPPEGIRNWLNQKVTIAPASTGVSELQRQYRVALIAMGLLVVLVLLIACVNVANLMTAQAASRAREMALRVSIGAGRRRLVQLVMVESALLAVLSTAMGAVFAWRAAPLIVEPIGRLALPADWRVAAAGLALMLGTMLLFGLAPALRASAVKPASALKGGADPHTRRGLMHSLVAAQVAFCFLVLFVAGLMAATFERLSHQDLGFRPEHLLALDTIAPREEAPVYWQQAAERLRAVAGVEQVTISSSALLSGDSSNSFISVNAAPPDPTLGFFQGVSPDWRGVMGVRLVEGLDLQTDPEEALVNQTFVKTFFHGSNALGRQFAAGKRQYRVVGVVGDTAYRSLREPPRPVAFVQLRDMARAAFLVRTSRPLAAKLSREAGLARSEFRVGNVRTQTELIASQTVRERMLAVLGVFFAAVALALAAIGLYGVLDYAVLQRRKEFGIRIAIGARAGDIARRVTGEILGMVLAGAVAGLGFGVMTTRYIEALLYRVKPDDLSMVAIPMVVIFSSALLAAVPAVVRAVRTDPVQMLRSE